MLILVLEGYLQIPRSRLYFVLLSAIFKSLFISLRSLNLLLHTTCSNNKTAISEKRRTFFCYLCHLHAFINQGPTIPFLIAELLNLQDFQLVLAVLTRQAESIPESISKVNVGQNAFLFSNIKNAGYFAL